MVLPKSRVLLQLIGWFIGGLLYKLVFANFRKETTLEEKIGNFFVDTVLPWMFGAFASNIPLVWLGAAACGVVFVLSVTRPGRRSAPSAKWALTVALLLSLYTLWIEPFMSVSATGVAGNLLMSFAKVSFKFVDMIVSFLWAVTLVIAFRHLDREYPRDKEVRPPQEVAT